MEVAVFWILVVLVGLSVSLCTVAIAVGCAWAVRARHRARAVLSSYRPHVTILKPLRGVDESLEGNLESFARLDYPSFDIICCTLDPADPAVAIARRVAARHPRCQMQIMAGAGGTALNPKVLLLEAMLPHATGELILISDSNVLAAPADLVRLVAPLANPRVGLVYQYCVGLGEESAAAAIENAKLTEFAGVGMIVSRLLAGTDAVMGKGMLLRREALRSMGDFERVRDVLCEDYMTGVELKREGWQLEIGSEPVQVVHTQWSLRQTFQRHARHASMRRVVSPATYPIELFLNPVALALLAPIVGGWLGLAVFLAVCATKVAMEAAGSLILRGDLPRRWYVLLAPVKDVMMLGVWTAGLFSNTVNWRGTLYRIAENTRLIPLTGPLPRPAQPVPPSPAPARRKAG